MPPDTFSAIACPCCNSRMRQHRLAGNLQREVVLDLCFPCQCIWFDEFENTQLAPEGVIDLFRHIHAHRDNPRQPWADMIYCPRCKERMIEGRDNCGNGQFSYRRCPQRHGRLSSFSAFLMEKGFVRQLNGAEIAELAKNVQTILCPDCGTPVDITCENVCGRCRAPVAILDPDAVNKVLTQFSQPSQRNLAAQPQALAAALIAGGQPAIQTKSEAATASAVGASEFVDPVDLLVGGIELVMEILSAF